MKAIDLTTYKFYRPHQKGTLRILILSDIHFSPEFKSEKFTRITKFIREQNPDYLFLPGDLLDSTDVLDNPKHKKRLLRWLEGLGKIAPLLISLGNHDLYHRPTPGSKEAAQNVNWVEHYPTAFFCEVAALDNVHVLNNRSYEDKNLYVYGYTQSPRYFEFSYLPGTTIFTPSEENYHQMLAEVSAMEEKLRGKLAKLPEHKLKFAMIHSPVYLTDQKIAKKLQNFDYFISGHMHNGVVPPILNELWPTTQGLISPTRNLIPKNIRHTIKTNDDKLIVTGAVTTIQECTGPLKRLNALFPIYFTLLEFTNNKKYARKPYYKHKYW